MEHVVDAMILMMIMMMMTIFKEEIVLRLFSDTDNSSQLQPHRPVHSQNDRLAGELYNQVC